MRAGGRSGWAVSGGEAVGEMGRVLSYATYPAQTNWLLPVTTEPRNPDALRFTFHVLRRFLGGLPPDDMGAGKRCENTTVPGPLFDRQVQVFGIVKLAGIGRCRSSEHPICRNTPRIP